MPVQSQKVSVIVNKENTELVQTIAFGAGYKWDRNKNAASQRAQYQNAQQLFFYPRGDGTMTYSDGIDKDPQFHVLSVVDFCKYVNGNLELKPVPQEQSIDIGEYTAYIMPGNYITVGCQTLSKEVVAKLIKAWQS